QRESRCLGERNRRIRTELSIQSLCNACGIKSKKKRMALLGLDSKLGESLKRKLLTLGKEVILQRSMVEKQRRNLGEMFDCWVSISAKKAEEAGSQFQILFHF
ncbi:hypothetical protein U1Q18_047711, partial [Sarracenia purpurea var. burkii]